MLLSINEEKAFVEIQQFFKTNKQETSQKTSNARELPKPDNTAYPKNLELASCL